MKNNAVKRYVRENTLVAIRRLAVYYAAVAAVELGGVFRALMNISLLLAVINCAILCVLPLFFKSTWYLFDRDWEGEIIEIKQEKYIGSNSIFEFKNISFPLVAGSTDNKRFSTVHLPPASEQTETFCNKIIAKQKSGKIKVYRIPLKEYGEILPYKVGNHILHVKGTPYLYNQTLAETRGKNVCVICGKLSEGECDGCNLVVYG